MEGEESSVLLIDQDEDEQEENNNLSPTLAQRRNKSLQIRNTNLVYSWGRNEDGQLAITANKMANLPNTIRGFRGVVKEIASVRTHTAIVNTDGQIYMAGSLLFGKIGIIAQVNNFREFHLHKQMRELNRVQKVACGDYHTLALTDQGSLFSWGGSLWEKTGHKGSGIVRIERLTGQIVTDIACGDFHSIALNSEGQVYSWGGGGQNKNKGQLGHANKKDLPHPELIQFFKGKKVRKIACGDYHTMVLTRDEELFAFGEGNYGQLGTGAKEDTASPRKVALNYSVGQEQYFGSGQQTRVEQMSLGGNHSLILTNRGQVYVCGKGAQGQLGLGMTKNKYEPVLVQALLSKTVTMVAAGANHSLCLTSRGDVYSCGYNVYGQLGLGDERSMTLWTQVAQLQGKRVTKIFAGGDHSWAVLNEQAPNIDDYEPPSPIRIAIDTQGPKLPSTQLIKKPTTDEPVIQLSTNKKLELITTEVQLSHRFVHFVFRDKLVKNCKPELDKYIEAVKKVQGDRLKFFKLNQDGEILDGQGTLTLPGNPKGMSIMLVCELPPNADEHLTYVNTKAKIAIGELVMMDSNMLKVDGKVPPHNMWFFTFLSMFEDQLERVRFVELRPKTK